MPGREDQMANLLDRYDWDYVIGSIHFLRDQAVDLQGEYDIWRSSRPGQGLAALLRDARRARPQRDVRRHGPPGPGQGLGQRGPAAERRPAPLLRAGDGRHRRVGHRDRGLDRRPAQAGRRDLPVARRSSRCASRPAGRWRSPPTRTRPTSSPSATTTRSSSSTRSASSEIAVFENRERRMEPIG